MLSALIGILFTLVLAGVVWWALKRLLALIPLAEPFRTAVDVVMVLILVVLVFWIIAQLLGVAGVPVHWPKM